MICDSANIFLEYPFDRTAFYRGYIWRLNNRIKKNNWIKIIHDGSLPQRYEKFTEAQKKFVKRTLRTAAGVIVVNPLLERFVRTRLGYGGRIVEIGSLLPMEQKEGTALPEDVTGFMASYDKIILSAGTCEESYGFQQIVEAFKNAAPRLSGIRTGLIFVDGNFAETNAEYEKKRERLQREENVLLITKGLPHDVMLELMKKSDIFVRGFFFESYGISRAEAILCGTPVIATNVGKTDGMRLYEYGDIKTLEEHMTELLTRGADSQFDRWVEFYQREAESNFRILMETLKAHDE